MKKSFNIQELLQCKSKCHETKPMHPPFLLERAFQRDQEWDLKKASSFGGSHWYKQKQNKTNKLPSFIDRF
jgi:hypothetical protein